jgi:hypothetical protein
MKTKLTLFLIILLNVISISNAQVEVWPGGVPHTTSQIKESINDLPIMERRSFITPNSIVDNSEKRYMRDIFTQKHNCCAQASGIGYVFTYELNWLRDLSSDDSSRLYPTHFTYNFLNNGDPDKGSTIIDGWDIIKENGCPDIKSYGGMHVNGDSTNWMTGYDNYRNALNNRIDSMFIIDFREDPEEGLDVLKQWLFNHNNDTSEVGGLASFVTNMNACKYSVLLDSTPEAGKKIVSLWLKKDASGLNHQLTIVGYNDSVRWDINGNFNYSNTEDSNGDSIIDMRDWEIGALKLANSRENYADSGYVYWPYRLLADSALIDSVIYIAKVLDYEPELVLKANLFHDDRNSIRFDIDFGVNALDNTPEIGHGTYSAFAQKGGNYPILGYQNYDPLEVVLDYNQFFSKEDVGKLYLNVKHGNSNSFGYLSQFSIVDYRWGETFELDSEIETDTLEYYINWFSIDYDLIVPGDDQDITHDDTLYSNMVSRFNPTVKNNTTLTIENGVEIDMYNSNLIIEEGSTLIIEDNAIFTAKRGISKIIVNGNIQVDSNVTFSADEESTIELHLKTSTEFTECIFNNCTIESIADPLEISQCDFTNSYIKQTISDIEISDSDFSNSSIIASNPTMIPIQLENFASVTNCDFTTAFDGANSIIEIYGYKSYQVSDNIIDNISNPESTFHSISIDGSGTTESGYLHEISNNEVFCSYGFCDNDLSGITIYSSIANLQDNYIHGNVIGLQSLGNSQIYVNGNQNATNETQTQRIKNNSRYQVYASREAFPLEMHWNAIYSSDNSQFYVYHDVDMSTNPPDVDVQRNYWGPNFDPDINLCPFRHYIYEPVWDLSSGQLVQTSAQQLFETGLDQIADSNYTDAKSTFQQVVTSYPNEEPARNSLKEILYLEPLAGNNFAGLKNWYLTEPVILNNEQLFRLAQNLANKCDEKLENYPDAIEWYESIIENPETLEDSIFAIIDLEHLYWQMGIDTNLRSISYVGRLVQFKPKSFKDFKDHKDELLSLLHGGQSNSTENEESEQVFNDFKRNGELLQNIPNPFNGTTRISYHLLYESDVKLNIYSYNGQLINTIFAGLKSEGTHSTVIDASGFKSGIYFYSISINGQVTDIKKMTIIN